MYVYTIARKVDRKGLIFAIPYSFPDNYKFKIKSIIYFNIDLNNFHHDFIFYILLRSYFDFSSRFGIEIFLRAMKYLRAQWLENDRKEYKILSNNIKVTS